MRYLPEDPDRGERRVYGNSHLMIGGCLDQPDDRDEAAHGSSAGLGRPRHPPGEASAKTRREAVRLHELTYGTGQMAAEAHLYLIERYGRRSDRDTEPTR